MAKSWKEFRDEWYAQLSWYQKLHYKILTYRLKRQK